MEQGKRKISAAVAAVMVACVLAAFAILYIFTKGGAHVAADKGYSKVLIIGIDGMDPKVTERLMADGKLPNFRKLADEGSFLRLNTSYPPESPVAWTSIATGMNPGKHNLFDFIKRNPNNYLPELALFETSSGLSGTDYGNPIKGVPFWRITRDAGVPTSVIRWPVSFPPEKVEGHMLSGLGVPDIKGFLNGYSYYTTEDVDEDSGSSSTLVKVEMSDGVVETEVYGPRTKKLGKMVIVKVPMKIETDADAGAAELVIQNKTHEIELGEWSDWIRAEFKIGFTKKVYGIFKAYLVSAEPFALYVTTIQIDPENPVQEISYPKSYSAELAKSMGLYYTLGMPEETDGYVDGRIGPEAIRAQISDVENERNKMFGREFRRFNEELDRGILAFVYDSSDRTQHVFWDDKVIGGGEPGGESGVGAGAKVNPAIADYFEKKDAFLGKVLERMDDETALFIVSDHGFTSFERAVCVNRWLYENGYIKLKKEITEEDSGALFRHVDWEETKAYAVGFTSIYVNLKGREGDGIVEYEDKDKVVGELIEKLEALVDEKTGRKVINKAYRREELYSEKYLENAPDIIIGFMPGYRMGWKSPIGGFDMQVISDNAKKWSGDHLVDPSFVPGVLFSNVAIKGDSAHQEDLVPTMLDILEIPIPSEIDGRSLI